MGLIQEHTTPAATNTGYSATAASCHDIDIKGAVEERVVEGDDELHIQRYRYRYTHTII